MEPELDRSGQQRRTSGDWPFDLCDLADRLSPRPRQQDGSEKLLLQLRLLELRYLTERQPLLVRLKRDDRGL